VDQLLEEELEAETAIAAVTATITVVSQILFSDKRSISFVFL
jgi:hypothetical protein